MTMIKLIVYASYFICFYIFLSTLGLVGMMRSCVRWLERRLWVCVVRDVVCSSLTLSVTFYQYLLWFTVSVNYFLWVLSHHPGHWPMVTVRKGQKASHYKQYFFVKFEWTERAVSNRDVNRYWKLKTLTSCNTYFTVIRYVFKKVFIAFLY